MTKDEIIAAITANTEGILAPAKKVKDYPSGRELWAAGVTVTTADPDTLNNATQEFYWDPETDSAKWAGVVRKNYEAPEAPVPEPTAIEKAEIALNGALGAGKWKFVSIDDGPHGTVAKIRAKADNTGDYPADMLLAVSMAANGTPIVVESE